MTLKQTISTKLTYHPDWELSLPEKYAFQFHHQKLPDLETNQIQISGIHLEEYEDFFMVTAFIRQSLEKPITFELLDLIVLDGDQNIIARETFDMEKFGELPAFGCRPWKFIFDEDSKLIEGPFPTENWSIVFEIKQKEDKLEHSLDLDPNWENGLSVEQKEHLLQLVENLPPVKENEINFTGIQAARNENQDLIITLLIRNGSMKDISIE
ncbi:MAG: SLAP domain-containing protein, partial [Heyndrickxia sp.]